jgi:hypothetical protein
MKREEYAKIIKRMVDNRIDKMEENGCWFSLFFDGYTNTYGLYMGELNKGWDRCACIRPEEVF